MEHKQKWFHEVKFRQAVSATIDREAIVRLVYQGRGAALWGPVTPGNRRWVNASISRPSRSLERARSLLKEAGFSWMNGPNGESELVDSDGKHVEFGIASFDADPNSDINVWLSSGGMHLWNPSQAHPATAWETEIDNLMEEQLAAPSYEQRKKRYDRVQQILAENQPMIFLASPDILVGAKNVIGNFHPAVLEPYVLWNVEQLYFRNGPEKSAR